MKSSVGFQRKKVHYSMILTNLKTEDDAT